MKPSWCSFGLALFAAGLMAASAPAAPPLERVANTTLQMPPAPPVFGYTVVNAFGNLTVTNPVALASPPGETNRLFVVEQAGRIAVITNLTAPNRTTFLDISSRVVSDLPQGERGLLGLAFHPGYATNGCFYVFYTGNTTTAAGTGLHDILARYQVSPTNANLALTNEVRLIAQYDQADNHNAGDLHFGPDGYLYVSLGDEGGQNDFYNNSQRITNDFFSGLLRIDVDNRPGNLPPNPHPASFANYSIPADNPFVGATSFNGAPVNPASVRTEFWAVGLRNPWRFSFDPLTGHLYCGDVGQSAWEEIDLITAGGNYGWAYREGSHPGPKSPPVGFTAMDPLLDYGHGNGTNQGYAVIGGVAYRGMRISQLAGHYVFADNVSGNIWTLLFDGTNATGFQRIAGEGGIAAFGVDPANGDVLMANQTSDTIRRLAYSTNFVGTPFPSTLAGTGAFTNLAALAPAPGIVPYDINVPFWSDHALKWRWFSVPDTNQTITFSRDGNWTFPPGSVWIKHFELELTNGAPESRVRLETRLLVKTTNGVYGVTYRWTTPPTNALLVADEGLDEPFIVNDGGNLRTQVWHYPSRQECLLCHTRVAGYALGFNTAQLNRPHDYGGTVTNQIAALSLAGYFHTNVTGWHTLRALAAATDEAVSREYRVRSYLAANCVQCHQPGGTTPGFWDARLTTPTAAAGLINGPLFDDEDDPNNRVVVPGSLTNSMLLTRISTPGTMRMPPLASSELDTQAIALVSAWITNDLPSYQSFADWQLARFGSTNAPEAGPDADPDADGAVNYLEYLTGTDPWQGADRWTLGIRRSNDTVQIVFPQAANRGFEVQSRPSPAGPAPWTPLDVAGNAPFFSASNRTATVTDAIAPGTNIFYRVGVFAP
jgi:glucose/arabinose dehydrogenase/mono/diheme cytochrome c family protein